MTPPTTQPSREAMKAAEEIAKGCLDYVTWSVHEENNKPVNNMASIIDTHTNLKALLRIREAAENLLAGVEHNGEWDDGCYYWKGLSASEIEAPLKALRAALDALNSSQ